MKPTFIFCEESGDSFLYIYNDSLKSISFKKPSLLNIMLPGLMSLCTIRELCREDTAKSNCSII